MEYCPERSIGVKQDLTIDWSSDVVDLLAKSEYGQAENVARREFEVTGDPHAFLMMVSAAMRERRFFDAKNDFESHTDLLTMVSPVRKDLRQMALKCYLETRDIDRARTLIENIISDEGETPNIMLKKASAFLKAFVRAVPSNVSADEKRKHYSSLGYH